MRVSVTSLIDRLSPSTQDSIRTRVSGTLTRFMPRIAEVSILVIDENGPRGGVDKVCRVNVQLRGQGTVTTTARHEKLMASVNEAVRRARRIVLTKLKRPLSKRLRQKALDLPDQDDATLA